MIKPQFCAKSFAQLLTPKIQLCPITENHEFSKISVPYFELQLSLVLCLKAMGIALRQNMYVLGLAVSLVVFIVSRSQYVSK